MKINLVGQSFNENSGQGVYEFSRKLNDGLKELGIDTKIIETGTSKSPIKTLLNNIFMGLFKCFRISEGIYHFMMPEIAFPVLFKRHSIVTIHDLIPLKINARSKIFTQYFKIAMNVALKANYIITDSESTKKDILELFTIDPKKISVIYLGVDSLKFCPIRSTKRNKKVIGYVGGFGKRKNIDFILQLAKELEDNKNIVFKLAGKGPEKEKMEGIAKRLGLTNVEFFGFVPDKELNKFYNSLDLFIFPSLYEGFGLPVLEAMACGVPVVVSNRSSLPEIVENAGILIDLDLKRAKAKIENVLTNKELLKELSEKGIKRAKEFTWKKTAKETLEIYKEILK